MINHLAFFNLAFKIAGLELGTGDREIQRGRRDCFLEDRVIYWVQFFILPRILRGRFSLVPEDLGSIPGLGRSSREGKGYPFQYSGLENSMDYIVHGVAKSRTGLSDFHFHFSITDEEIESLKVSQRACAMAKTTL